MEKQTDTRNKRYLILLAAALSLLILSGGYFYYRYEQQEITRERFEEIKTIARIKVEQITTWQKQRLADANAIYRNPFFEQDIEQFLFHGHDIKLKKNILKQLSYTRTQGGYENIFLTSPEAEPVFAVDTSLQQIDPTTKGFIARAALQQKIIVTDLYYCNIHKKVHYDILVPVMDAGGKSIAVLVFRVDPQTFLYPKIQSWPKPSGTSEILIVRKNGDSVLYLNELRFQTHTALKLQIPMSRTSLPAVRSAMGFEGVWMGNDYRDVPVLAYLCKVPETSWYMVAKVDRSEIFSELYYRAGIITALTLTLIILTGVAFSWFYYARERNIYRELFLSEKKLTELEEEYRIAERESLKKLTESEERFRKSILEAPVPMLIHDEDDRCYEISKGWTKFSGYTLDDIPTMGDWTDRAYGERSGFAKEYIDKLFEINETVSNGIWDIRAKDGKIRKWDFYTTPIGVTTGNKRILLSIAIDITELKYAEEKLIIQGSIANIFSTIPDDEMFNEVLKVILDFMRSPFGVFGFVDEDGAMVVPTMTRQIWEKCQVPEKSIRFPRETWGDSSWPTAIREKRIVYSNNHSNNIPDGHVGITRHISVPILFMGEAIGLLQVANKASDYSEDDIQILSDIAFQLSPLLNARLKRQWAQQALSALSSRQNSILAAVPDIIMEVDNQKVYKWANQAGFSFFGENVIGTEANSYFIGNQETYQEVQPLFNGHQDMVYIESWQRRRDGKQRLIAWWCQTLKDENGAIIGAISSGRDITELKLAEEHLQQVNLDFERSNKELEQFAYIASHDLQEPLRMISSFTQLLAKRYKNQLGNDADEFIHFIVDGANRMQRLIQDLLSYSRINTRKDFFKTVDSQLVLGEAITNLQMMIRETGTIVTNDNLPVISADYGQMVQVFQNLIGNAIKFHSTKAPLVHISCTDEPDEWVFSVRDNGIGIEPQYFDRIFIIFQRLHAGNLYPGTGIGLAICNRVVNRHAGKMWVESEPEKGSVFYFSIKKINNA